MLSSCCCCISLRTGCIIIAVVGTLWAMSMLATSNWHWYYIVLGIFYLIANGVLGFGAIKYSQTAILVNLVLTAIYIILGTLFGLIMVACIDSIYPLFANKCAVVEVESRKIDMTCDQNKWKIGITYGIFFADALINSYFWLCSFSFYKELIEVHECPA